MASLRSEIRRFASASVLAATLTGSAFAQQPADPAEKAKLTQALAEQKAANEVDTAIADAEKTAKVSTAKAIDILKAAQTNLAVTVGLSSTKHEELNKKLEAKLATFQPKGTGPRPTVDPKAAEVKKGLRQKYDDDLTEAKEVAEGLKKYADLKDAGRTDEARRTVAGLTVKYPRNPFLDAGWNAELHGRANPGRRELQQAILRLNAQEHSQRDGVGHARDGRHPIHGRERVARTLEVPPEAGQDSTQREGRRHSQVARYGGHGELPGSAVRGSVAGFVEQDESGNLHRQAIAERRRPRPHAGDQLQGQRQRPHGAACHSAEQSAHVHREGRAHSSGHARTGGTRTHDPFVLSRRPRDGDRPVRQRDPVRPGGELSAGDPERGQPREGDQGFHRPAGLEGQRRARAA